MLVVEKVSSTKEREVNFRPGPASYVYMTCVAQISAVNRELVSAERR